MDWFAVAVASVVAASTTLWIPWSEAHRLFYKHWVGRQVTAMRVLAFAGHGAGGFAVAWFSTAVAGWHPVENLGVLNGVVYAAALEATVRADVSGFQIGPSPKVLSVGNGIAVAIGKALDSTARTRIREHLKTFDAQTAASMVKSEILAPLGVQNKGQELKWLLTFNEIAESYPDSVDAVAEIGAGAAVDLLWVPSRS